MVETLLSKAILDHILVCVSWTATPSWLYLSDHRIKFPRHLQWMWQSIASSSVSSAGTLRSIRPRKVIRQGGSQPPKWRVTPCPSLWDGSLEAVVCTLPMKSSGQNLEIQINLGSNYGSLLDMVIRTSTNSLNNGTIEVTWYIKRFHVCGCLKLHYLVPPILFIIQLCHTISCT